MLNMNKYILFLFIIICSCSESDKIDSVKLSKSITQKSNVEEPSKNICLEHGCELKTIEGYTPVYLPTSYIYHDFYRLQSGSLPNIRMPYISELTPEKFKELEESSPGFLKKVRTTYCEQCTNEFSKRWATFRKLSEADQIAYLKANPSKIEQISLEIDGVTFDIESLSNTIPDDYFKNYDHTIEGSE